MRRFHMSSQISAPYKSLKARRANPSHLFIVPQIEGQSTERSVHVRATVLEKRNSCLKQAVFVNTRGRHFSTTGSMWSQVPA